ncbi:transposase [Cellulomonas oligotrophica]|uniref:Uncharacterized protein n=1 Tax=Cellulomonas oligotrophica TaxID=931536 RepID=A0A7Y9K153_9CELL|nr:transposase [Cellulomonas oligotrophica]NYD88010.1 hypothetical protein [Cellulomonas oligotrophica]
MARLERRKRADAALISVVATCYSLGVSTRRIDKLVESSGMTSLSNSQVSRAWLAPSMTRSPSSGPGIWPTPGRSRSSRRTR